MGKYSKSCTLVEDVMMQLKGTPQGDESLYLIASGYYKRGDYDLAATYFKQYYTSYPNGRLAELARLQSGRSLYMASPEARLDQTDSYHAIQELQIFLEYYPNSRYKEECNTMIYALQDKLADKELESVKLYYNLGTYLGNNYQSCIITAQNALKNYPYSKLREDFSIYILRARYQMALNSIEERLVDRFRETQDECYSFKNEYPTSAYNKEVSKILERTTQIIKNK